MIEAHLAFDEVKDLPALCSDKFFTLGFTLRVASLIKNIAIRYLLWYNN